MHRISLFLKAFLPSQILFLLVCAIVIGGPAVAGALLEEKSFVSGVKSWLEYLWLVGLAWVVLSMFSLSGAIPVARGRFPAPTMAVMWGRIKWFLKLQWITVGIIVTMILVGALFSSGLEVTALPRAIASVADTKFWLSIWGFITLLHGTDAINGATGNSGGSVTYQASDDDAARLYDDDRRDDWRHTATWSQGGHMPDPIDMSSSSSDSSESYGTNPANGQPMISDCFDVSGNAYGTDSSSMTTHNYDS